jgi:hypothetical protein
MLRTGRACATPGNRRLEERQLHERLRDLDVEIERRHRWDWAHPKLWDGTLTGATAETRAPVGGARGLWSDDGQCT